MKTPVHVGIVANLTKPEAISTTREIASRLRALKASVLFETATAAACEEPSGLPLAQLTEEVDLIVVLGGDGTILWTAQVCGAAVKPLAALNTGRLGFLTTATEQQIDDFVAAIARRNFTLSHRNLVGVEFVSSDSVPRLLVGLNEVTLTRGARSHLIRLEVAVDGVPLNRFNGDGLIVATPTGSTAYSLSAGGPIVSPGAAVFLITPICAHALASRAFVTEDHVTLTITAKDQQEEILLTVDGGTPFPLHRDTTVTVKKAAYHVPLVVLGETTFYEVLQQKLRWMSTSI